MANVHEQSREGFAAGGLYDKLRPRYNPEVLSRIQELVDCKGKLNIVEIGCGSGLFTTALLEQWSDSIETLKCYDPNEGMLKVFRENIKDPRVSTSEGTFDSTDAEDGWADLIVIATAFHWCLDLEAAIKEFIRILKPDGVVCLLWNAEDRENTRWFKELFDAAVEMPSKVGRTPLEYFGWQKVFDLPIYKESFQPQETTTVKYSTPSTMETFTERIKTWSPIAVLTEEQKEEFVQRAEEIIKKADGLVWIDEKEGVFEIPFAVPIILMKRKIIV